MADYGVPSSLELLELERSATILRFTSCALVNLVLAIIFTILNFFVDWGQLRFFNGDPAAGAQNALMTFALRESVFQQLSGNLPTNQRRFDQAWYGEALCSTAARTSDLCIAILIKIETGTLLEVVLIVVAGAAFWGMCYFSWLTHQLRWGLLTRNDDSVRVGPYGCLLTEDGLSWSWKDWLRDPCASIALLSGALVFGTVVGLVGWPIGIELMRVRLVQAQFALGNFGLDPGQFGGWPLRRRAPRPCMRYAPLSRKQRA